MCKLPIMLITFATLVAATNVHAEAWTYTDSNGQEQNTDACPRQDCRDNPKPQPPVQIEGEKPDDNPPNLIADKRDYEPPVSTYIGYWCVNPNSVLACVDCADPKSGKPRPPLPLKLKSCGPLVHIKGGVIGQW